MDKRFLPAFTVGLILVALWFFVGIPLFYGPLPPTQDPDKGATKGNGGSSEKKDPPEIGVTPDPDDPPSVIPNSDLPDLAPRTVSVTLGNLALTFTNVGAQVTDLALVDPAAELLPPSTNGKGAFGVRHPGTGDNLVGRGWEVIKEDDSGVAFQTTLGNGLIIRKFFEPGENPDVFTVRIELENKTEGPLTFTGVVDAFNGIEHDGPYRYEMYHSAIVAAGSLDRPSDLERYVWREEKKDGEKINSLERWRTGWFNEDEPAHKKIDGGSTSFVALKNRYFTLALSPASAADHELWKDVGLHATKLLSRNPDPKEPEKRRNIRVDVELNPLEVENGETRSIAFTVYAGPLKADRIPENLGDPLVLIDYRGIDFVCQLLLWTLGLFKDMNWGVAIILTTLLIRLVLLPFSLKSQSSMMRMAEMSKKLKPKMDAIRARYKDDPRRLQQEMMAMYRQEGHNPFSAMGGCLILFIQLPIFIGMYSVVDAAVDLRLASFLWISDLSQPDRTIDFGGPIIFGMIDAINVLPIIMGITWTLQSFLTPMTSTDPQQAQMQKMMRFMPIMFVFFCYGLASGLSLYFFVNSLLGIIETRVVRKYILKPKT